MKPISSLSLLLLSG